MIVVYLTHKPMNIRKRHKVNNIQEAIKIYEKSLKDNPNKHWILEDDEMNTIKCSWDEEDNPPEDDGALW